MNESQWTEHRIREQEVTIEDVIRSWIEGFKNNVKPTWELWRKETINETN